MVALRLWVHARDDGVTVEGPAGGTRLLVGRRSAGSSEVAFPTSSLLHYAAAFYDRPDRCSPEIRSKCMGTVR